MIIKVFQKWLAHEQAINKHTVYLNLRNSCFQEEVCSSRNNTF